MTIGWIDASSGASGDMLLGVLVDAGVPLAVIEAAVAEVSPEPVGLRAEPVTRAGFRATRVHVEVPDSRRSRTWADIQPLLTGDRTVRAARTFTLLAEAEARVHGTTPEQVHFHEVGALDAIADVVGVCAGLDHLGLERLVVSTVAVGGGVVETGHGTLGVPAPATAALLTGVPTRGGPIEQELCTPTGAALLVANADDWGPQPELASTVVGVGAGGRDPAGHANVIRLVLGEPCEPIGHGEPCEPIGHGEPCEPIGHGEPGSDPVQQAGAVLLETNVDDLDPRIWPAAMQALFDAGASDAWLTPILMKKGRPAYTLSVLARADRADVVRREVFRHTSAIGLREQPVGKHALDRSFRTVRIDGHDIDVKLASLDGELLNVQPEYEHVAAAARALGHPVKTVLARAVAAAQED